MGQALTDPDIILDQITPDLIEAVWPHLEPLFARACSRVLSAWTPDDILVQARDGRLSLWAIYDRREPLPFLGALSTSVKTVRGRKIVTFEHLGGRELGRWFEQVATEIENLGRSQGAVAAQIEGRMGWERIMRGLGYRPSRVILEKAL